jgi:integrase
VLLSRRGGHRTIDLDKETKAVLKRHRTEQLEELLAIGAPTDVGFSPVRFGGPLRAHSIGQAFNRLVVTWDDLPRTRLHDLVHTHASHLLAPATCPHRQ